MTKARTPEEVDRLFEARVNAGDLDGLVALYEPDATLATEDAGNVIGHAAIRAYLQTLVGVKTRMDMGTYRVIPAGDGLAVVHHDWKATITTPDGQEMALTGKATEVVRRQPDGSWLFALDEPNMRG
jgi:uncharacterized protein (TIGR02246 family)